MRGPWIRGDGLHRVAERDVLPFPSGEATEVGREIEAEDLPPTSGAPVLAIRPG